MEIIEHVEDVDFFLKSCSKLLKKNGIMFVATLNKTLKSYLFAIIGAEYILDGYQLELMNGKNLLNLKI